MSTNLSIKVDFNFKNNFLTIYESILNEVDILNLIESQEVKEAKDKIDKLMSGSVYFDIPLSKEIKDRLSQVFSLDFSKLKFIPMRWIKGDTVPHIDSGIKSFNNTYLAYITDSPGSLIFGNDKYPILKGSFYQFKSGINHGTINTSFEPRLLLGPMSEEGFAVGGVPGIYFPGNTNVYIRQDISGQIEYSTDPNFSLNFNLYFPCLVTNTDTSLGYLKIIFKTDIVLDNGNQYFQINSEKIQFGSQNINNDSTIPTITIQVPYWDGLITNGTELIDGFSNIRIYNLFIDGSGNSTQITGGWLCKQFFGRGAINNYIINCGSSGTINGGGITGSYTASNSGQLHIIGCYSYGTVENAGSGGIIGKECGDSSGNIYIDSCWTTGLIDGNNTGGIAGENNYVTITNCYSTGIIFGNNSGGIIGASPFNCSITSCYSNGNIHGRLSGGICGLISPEVGFCNVIINNCYSSGTIRGTFGAGGICGQINNNYNLTIQNCYVAGSNNSNEVGYIIGSKTNGDQNFSNFGYTINNCYSESYHQNSGWNNSHAKNCLTGYPSNSPGVGTTWYSSTSNNPYFLKNIGYTPYTYNNISSTPDLVRTFSSSINSGNSTSEAIQNGTTFQILLITGGISSSYGDITINSINGKIITTASVKSATYTIYIYNASFYTISTFTLTVKNNNFILPKVNENNWLMYHPFLKYNGKLAWSVYRNWWRRW